MYLKSGCFTFFVSRFIPEFWGLIFGRRTHQIPYDFPSKSLCNEALAGSGSGQNLEETDGSRASEGAQRQTGDHERWKSSENFISEPTSALRAILGCLTPENTSNFREIANFPSNSQILENPSINNPDPHCSFMIRSILTTRNVYR